MCMYIILYYIILSLLLLWLCLCIYMGMDQYLLILFLGGWTSIYQLFWCSPGVQGFDTLPYIYIYMYIQYAKIRACVPQVSRLGKWWSTTGFRIPKKLPGMHIQLDPNLATIQVSLWIHNSIFYLFGDWWVNIYLFMWFYVWIVDCH